MSFLQDLQKNNPDLFKSDYKDPPYTALEEKIERLRLTKERLDILRSMPVEDFSGSYNPDEYERSCEIIDVDKVVGFKVNHCVVNWYEALDSRVLHKPLTFEKFDPENPERFDEYLIAENTYDPPSVIEIDGKYFVDGDGTHRLTIAKVLGNKKARVMVRKRKKL